MSKELTEKFKAGKLPLGYYYVDNYIGWSKEVERIIIKYTGLETEQAQAKEVLAPVPSYRDLYGENDGNMPTGVFTVLKIIKRDIENAQKRRSLTDLECGIKSQVVSLLKKWGVK